MEIAILVALGVLIVLVVAGYWLRIGRTKKQPAGADITEELKAQFGSLSLEALGKAQKTFLDLAETRFKALTEAGSSDLLQKKTLIDQQLEQMKTELGKVSKSIGEFELDREKKFAELNTNLKSIGVQTAALTTSTSGLREVLASSQARGQWGERMAEDILRSAGFVEGVNYIKQTAVESGTGRPDYTFLLPRSLQLNMDVKFPFENYARYVQTKSDSERQGYRASFLRDVRSRIRELANREYIDPSQSTVDYVLFFIPNEGVFAFIRDEDPEVFDFALKSKVVCCSPLTLFAVLSVVRQAVDNFALEQTANEILSLMGQFNRQWAQFEESVKTVGNRLTSAQRAFEDMAGTRTRALSRPLRRIDELRQRRGIPIAEGEDDAALHTADVLESGTVDPEEEE